MNKKTVRELHREKRGKVSDKWDSYLSYYDELLAGLRDREISMLEVGVQNGGSMETWSQYFEAGKIFIGCDIDPNCSRLIYDDPRVNIVIGDANSQDAYGQITKLCSAFDLIIDDGSHQSIDVLNSFINYFPLVKPGGIYIVEDSHCLYLKDFGGGILNEYSAQSFFKKLADVVSYQWWENDVSLSAYLQSFFIKTGPPSFISEGWIDSIAFRNSVITVRKAQQPGHKKLGDRIVSGTEALVQTWGGRRPT